MKKSISVLFASAVLVAGVLPAYAQQPSVSQNSIILAQAEDPAAIAQDFINQLAQQRFAVAVQSYDAASLPSVTPQTLQQNWNDIVAESGAFQGVSNAQTVSLGQGDSQTIVRVTSQFESGNRDLFVVLSGNEVVSFSPVEE